MVWIYLLIAGIFEVIWAVSMKYSDGFTRLTPSVITVAGMIISFYFLALTTRDLPLGTAYAIWTGIGAVGTIIVGVLLMNEPLTLARIGFLLLIVVGIIGVKFTSGH
ncbi:quaternary ammonium compound efflux SMR transporter SugE [Paenibacillus sp. y28]|uniref:quaternary ammonium compound efflux SMR transporter SugE n=1 Tax=Paenibacillus sp. y28 TaxID=3129110 RepID=UPI003017F698